MRELHHYKWSSVADRVNLWGIARFACLYYLLHFLFRSPNGILEVLEGNEKCLLEKEFSTAVSIPTDVITTEILKAYKRQVPLFLLFCSLGWGMYSNKMWIHHLHVYPVTEISDFNTSGSNITSLIKWESPRKHKLNVSATKLAQVLMQCWHFKYSQFDHRPEMLS